MRRQFSPRSLAGLIDADHIAANWREILRLATSIRSGAVQASAMLKSCPDIHDKTDWRSP
jgi:TnpA family transposase